MRKCESRRYRGFLVVATMLLVSAGASHAQTDAEVNAGIQFSFASPGARSMGLGGAFVGLADDATAAFTNPAGLVQLSKLEVSAEARRSSYTSQFTDHGHGLGIASNMGRDTITGLRSDTSTEDINNLSFTSLVYPRGRWAVAVYRQELANFAASFKTQGAFLGTFLGTPQEDFNRLYPVDTALRLRIINVGVSGAFRVTDALSIGVGLSEYHFNLSSLTNRYFLPASNPDGSLPPDLIGDPNYTASNVVNFQTLEGSDNNLSGNAGLLWKFSSQWSAGAVFRKGPKFRFDTANTAGPALGIPGIRFATHSAFFHVPDVFGAGLAFRPAENWTITADYDRIRYSQLAKGSIDIFLQQPDPKAPFMVEKLMVNDGNEFHLGVEYVWTKLRYPLAMRLGGWHDPDHKIRFNGNPTDPAMDPLALSVSFRPGQAEYHATGGLGLVMGERFQIDAAYDYSRFLSIASLSAVWRF